MRFLSLAMLFSVFALTNAEVKIEDVSDVDPAQAEPVAQKPKKAAKLSPEAIAKKK